MGLPETGRAGWWGQRLGRGLQRAPSRFCGIPPKATKNLRFPMCSRRVLSCLMENT